MRCTRCEAEFDTSLAVAGENIACPHCGLSYRIAIDDTTGELTFRPSRRRSMQADAEQINNVSAAPTMPKVPPTPSVASDPSTDDDWELVKPSIPTFIRSDRSTPQQPMSQQQGAAQSAEPDYRQQLRAASADMKEAASSVAKIVNQRLSSAGQAFSTKYQPMLEEAGRNLANAARDVAKNVSARVDAARMNTPQNQNLQSMLQQDVPENFSDLNDQTEQTAQAAWNGYRTSAQPINYPQTGVVPQAQQTVQSGAGTAAPFLTRKIAGKIPIWSVLIVAALILVVSVFSGGNSKYAKQEVLLRKIERAINNGDINALTECFQPSYQQLLSGVISMYTNGGANSSLWDLLGISNPQGLDIKVSMSVKDFTENGNRGTIHAHMRNSFNGQVQEQDTDIPVIREGNDWYLSIY